MGVKVVSGPGPRAVRRGLGDAVEVVAKPIARVLGISDCAACERRKQALNTAGARAAARLRKMIRG